MANTTRRRASWGSLQYDPKTRTGRIRYWADGADGYRRRSKTVRGTRRECEEARARLMLEHGDDAPCPTVAQIWERYVRPDYVRRVEDGDVSKRSLQQLDSTWRVHVEPRWSDVTVDHVRALDVQQWLLGGMTLSSAKFSLSLMRTVMDHANRYELVATNVMRNRYTMPSKSTVTKRDGGTWTLAQLGDVWRHVHDSHIEPAFLLAAFGGCRVGESLGPMADEVREVSGHPTDVATVRIVRQAQSRGGMTDRLKTEHSARSVIIVGRAATRMLELARASQGDWLTGNGVGGPVTQSQLVKTWGRLVPEDLLHPFKNLRNSWQTNMRWELGIPPWIVEPMMGHVGEGVTGRHYDRPSEEMFAKQVVEAYMTNRYDVGWTWLDAC